MKYNLTLKYHDSSKEPPDNQSPQQLRLQQQSQINETKSNEAHKYFESESRQSDAIKLSTKEQTQSDDQVNDKTITTGRETVQQSIERRKILIQKILNSQMDPESLQKTETIRFVDVASPPVATRAPSPQLRQAEIYQRNDEKISPNRVQDDAFTPLRARSPKSVSFHPQSESDILGWKRKQQEAFMAELHRKENEHLRIVEEEWLQQHSREEEKLAARMKKCKMLTEALEHGLNAIKVIMINRNG